MTIDPFSHELYGKKFGTVLIDPPWRFTQRTGKVSPEHKRLFRYETMSFDEIYSLPVSDYVTDKSHCYLWVPNALLPEGLKALQSFGFTYKTNLIWHKIRKDGLTHKGGVGFYFRNATEMVLFGVRNKHRTINRTQINLFSSQRREHSRKPEELYDIIENCSQGPFLELFARAERKNWTSWGNQSDFFN